MASTVGEASLQRLAPVIHVEDPRAPADSLPFDQALRDDANAFFRIFSRLSPQYRDGVQCMNEVYRRIRMQEKNLSSLYGQARDFCKSSFTAAVEIEALHDYIPVFSSELHRHLAGVNEGMEEGKWDNVAAKIKMTQHALETLVTKMQDIEQSLHKVREEAMALKDTASKAVSDAQHPIRERVLQQATTMMDFVRTIMISTSDALTATGTAIDRFCDSHSRSFEMMAASLASLEVGVLCWYLGASGAGIIFGIHIGMSLAAGAAIMIGWGALSRLGYGAYCLVSQAKNFLERLQDYEAQRLDEIKASVQVVHDRAEKSEKEASNALAVVQEETKNLKRCIAQMKQLHTLASNFATNKENHVEMDENARLKEIKHCQQTFHKLWEKLGIEKHPDFMQSIMPDLRAMSVLIDTIEPRSLDLICDDEIAAVLSEYAYNDRTQLDVLKTVEIRNPRRHNAPGEGFFSHVVVAEVFAKCDDDDDKYPALFIAFKGSNDVEWIANVNCAPNWNEFDDIDKGHSIALHRGYHGEIKAARSFLLQTLVDTLLDTRLKRVVFCGHSHGGALAQMSLVFIFMESQIHKWKTIEEATATKEEHVRKHVRYLLEHASAVCFASPQILGFNMSCATQNALPDKLSCFMYDRAINYCWRCDPVPRCFSHVDFDMLQACIQKKMPKIGKLWNLAGWGQTQIVQLLDDQRQALKVFRHVSKNILFCDEDQCPDKWKGGTWNGCKYDIDDHRVTEYTKTLRKFKDRDTSLKAFVLKDGEPHQVLWQTRD